MSVAHGATDVIKDYNTIGLLTMMMLIIDNDDFIAL